MDAVFCPAVQHSEDSKDHSDSGVSSQTLISSDIYPAVIAIYLMQNKHCEWMFHYLCLPQVKAKLSGTCQSQDIEMTLRGAEN